MIDWDEEWFEANDRSPLKVTSRNIERWKRFWSEDAEYYLNDIKSEMPLYEGVVDRLRAEGWLDGSDDVLDICSGPGTFTFPLSRHARTVTALDESENMLRVLEDECRMGGMDNVRTLLLGWQDFEERDRYDLVLSALSPVICSREDLDKMERASRSKCCFITAGPSDWMNLRNDLWNRLMGDFRPSDARSVKYPLNILLSSNRNVELYDVHFDTISCHPENKVVNHYLSYFRIFTEMDDDKERIVRDRIAALSNDGILTIEGRKRLHVLCWSV